MLRFYVFYFYLFVVSSKGLRTADLFQQLQQVMRQNGGVSHFRYLKLWNRIKSGIFDPDMVPLCWTCNQWFSYLLGGGDGGLLGEQKQVVNTMLTYCHPLRWYGEFIWSHIWVHMMSLGLHQLLREISVSSAAKWSTVFTSESLTVSVCCLALNSSCSVVF